MAQVRRARTDALERARLEDDREAEKDKVRRGQ